MKTKFNLLAALAVPAMVMATPSTSKANNVGVAQCEEFALCWSNSSPTPFSTFISLPDLNFLGEGTSVFLVANQDSGGIMRLGTTIFTFSFTPGGGVPGAGPITPPVTEVIGEFNGGFHAGPCPMVPFSNFQRTCENSATIDCAVSRSYVRHHMPLGFSGIGSSSEESPPRRYRIFRARRIARSIGRSFWEA